MAKSRITDAAVLHASLHLLSPSVDPTPLPPLNLLHSVQNFVGRLQSRHFTETSRNVPVGDVDGTAAGQTQRATTDHLENFDSRFLLPGLSYSIGLAISQRQRGLLETLCRGHGLAYGIIGLSCTDDRLRARAYEVIVATMQLLAEDAAGEFSHLVQVSST